MASALRSQEFNATLTQALAKSWPTYNGDYSGRRFSELTQINTSNVISLSFAWIWRSDYNAPSAGGFVLEDTTMKATPLEVDGILYFSEPDNAWAVDARTGRQLWHYRYPPNQGFHIASRGMAKYGDWLYFETPDDYLVSLDARTGKERWRVELADVALDYYSTMAPVIVKDHVIVSVGGDTLDNPCFLEARDPRTGELQWKWYTEAQPGDPEAKTWPNEFAMKHGGGAPWLPGTYDPKLNLIYWTVGNPNPVYDGDGRVGDNLWTDSIVALNPDTGKLVWYFQTTKHDTHDWDATQTPVLFDAPFRGHPRQLLAQANRNGFFFVLDRTNGKNLLTVPFVRTNWSLGINSAGQPIPNPEKDPTMDGALVCPGSAANWPAPSFDPQTGLFYVRASEGCGLFFRTTEGKGEGFAGKGLGGGPWKIWIRAIDYQTGKIVWSHPVGGEWGGILTTASGLLFSADAESGTLLALDAKTGDTLWHVFVNDLSNNPPITYELDGHQYVLFGVRNSLWAFRLPDKGLSADVTSRRVPAHPAH
ncbi:MAG: acido-empty-quinoprotein group A [Candidatus Acidiferrales bacterium]